MSYKARTFAELIFESDWYFYSDNMLGCGGGGSPDTGQEALESEEASFDSTLQQIFQSQYSNQQQQLQYLQGKLEPEINNPQGYTPQQLATLRTSATDTNSAQYQNAQAALNNQISSQSGGSKLTGVAGATGESDAALLNQEAVNQAGAQDQITEANANLQQQNYWNAINALNGVAAQENPLGYATASTQAAEASSAASQANSEHIQATQTSFLGGALGGLFGGAGTAASGIWCWVAASFFGWNDSRTWVIRLWMRNQAPYWFRIFYQRNGAWIAKTPLRWAFRPVFDYVLRMA